MQRCLGGNTVLLPPPEEDMVGGRRTVFPPDGPRLSDRRAKQLRRHNGQQLTPDDSHGASNPTSATRDCIWWSRPEVAPQCRHPTSTLSRAACAVRVFGLCRKRAQAPSFKRPIRLSFRHACLSSPRAGKRTGTGARNSRLDAFPLDAGLALRRIARSVEVGRHLRIEPVLPHPQDLLRRRAADRQRRQACGSKKSTASVS